MHVSGQHEFNVSVQQLWNYLMDPQVLAKITPGVTQLKTLSPDQYQSISDIKIGPVKGTFKGKLGVLDKQIPQSFTIQMEQLSKIGNAHVKVNMVLDEVQAEKSRLTFDGKAKLSGVIARTGQRVLSGVANTITKEVFASLEQHIETEKKEQPSLVNKQPAKVIQVETNDKQVIEITQKDVVSKQPKNTVHEKNTNQSTGKNTSTSETMIEPPLNLFARILNFIKKFLGIK